MNKAPGPLHRCKRIFVCGPHPQQVGYRHRRSTAQTQPAMNIYFATGLYDRMGKIRPFDQVFQFIDQVLCLLCKDDDQQPYALKTLQQ